MEIIVVLIGINLFVFILMKIDKDRALNHKHRISEYTFFVLSSLGGWIGILSGMKSFRHKTNKKTFLMKIVLGMGISSILLYLLKRLGCKVCF